MTINQDSYEHDRRTFYNSMEVSNIKYRKNRYASDIYLNLAIFCAASGLTGAKIIEEQFTNPATYICATVAAISLGVVSYNFKKWKQERKKAKTLEEEILKRPQSQ